MNLKAIITAAAAAAGLAVAPALSASAAVHAPPLPCSASVSNARPVDYTTTDVLVSTARDARVTTVAYYKTVRTTHAVTASALGQAVVPYYISGATPGFKVQVRVYADLGRRSGYCSTSFIPQARPVIIKGTALMTCGWPYAPGGPHSPNTQDCQGTLLFGTGDTAVTAAVHVTAADVGISPAAVTMHYSVTCGGVLRSQGNVSGHVPFAYQLPTISNRGQECKVQPYPLVVNGPDVSSVRAWMTWAEYR